MKNIILFFLLTIGLHSAKADCGMSGMQFFPGKRDISLNSMFIIQGYSQSIKTIDNFKNRTVFLESEDGKLIKLNLLEILKGKMYLAQAIFKPAEELKPNTIYVLKYSNQTDDETREMMQWNSNTKQNERVYWKTKDKKKNQLLNPNLIIKYKKTEVIEYGCGPSANAIFEIKNNSNPEIWCKTEMIDLTTKEKTIFYITEWEGKIHVGHGMCAGGFSFNKSGKYKVRFTPMNIDGNSLKTTEWKIFRSPYIEYKGLY
jgi:hypothetical protein